MTVSTEVYVHHSELGLVPTIESLTDVEISVVPEASTAPSQDVYSYWVAAEDFEAVDDALDADHTVADFTTIWETDDRHLYRIEYSEQAELISPSIIERGGLMIESQSEGDGWLVRLQFPDHGTLYEIFEDAWMDGIEFQIREINQGNADTVQGKPSLTESQIEALVAGYEHGYYDEPRDTSLEELGAVLGISPTAVSGRLRRASARLIEVCFGYDDRETEGP